MYGHKGHYASSSYDPTLSLLDNRSDMDSDNDSVELAKSPTPVGWAHSATRPFIVVRSLPWRIMVVRAALFFVPSFLHSRHSRDRIRPTKLHPTAYLDGMRGLAALFVFLCHYTYQCFTIAESYGYGDDNWAWLKLPIVRLFYQGPAAVCIFFVISGYALSYKPLKLIRSKSTGDLLETLSSLVFRRAIRLFFPAIISSLMIIFFVRLGAYDLTRKFANDRRYMKNVVEYHAERLDDTYTQLQEWFWCVFKFIHVFSWDPEAGRLKYDVHLWTIPVEYMCSLYLFLVLLGTARLAAPLRLLTVSGVAIFTYRSSRWEFLLFLAGMMIAEHDLIRGAHSPSPPSSPLTDEKTPTSSRPSGSEWIWLFVSVVALYLLSQPDANGHETPGWIYLCSLVPQWWNVEGYRYWQSAGAVLFVLAVGHCKTWQRLFNSGVVQYLGKISFAMYLMHGPALHIVGYHFEMMAYEITGVEDWEFNAGFILHACFCIPIVIWWSDIFWRAVDIPTVKFGKWFEQKCIACD